MDGATYLQICLLSVVKLGDFGFDEGEDEDEDVGSERGFGYLGNKGNRGKLMARFRQGAKDFGEILVD